MTDGQNLIDIKGVRVTIEQISIALFWLEEMESVHELHQGVKATDPVRANDALEAVFQIFYQRCHPLLEQIRKNNPEEETDEIRHS